MSDINLFDNETTEELPALNDRSGVWPAIVNVYQEHGFKAGYSRGVNDTLAAALESTEDFLRSRAGSDPHARRLLYAFSEFLEKRVRTNSPADDQPSFIDGLGI
jgi:hypothetical protein